MVGLFTGLLGLRHLLELLVDLAGLLAGLGELVGLGKWPTDGLAGVGDLAVRALGSGLSLGPALIETSEAGFEPRDQAAWVGVLKFSGGEPRGRAWGAVEGDDDRRRAERSFDVGGQREAAEMAGPYAALAEAVECGYLLLQEFLQMLPGFGALEIAAIADGHGKLVSSGVLAAGDGGVNVSDERRQRGDLALVPGDRMAERVLVAVVGTLSALQAGERGVGFGLVHEQRVAGRERLHLAERQGRVADVGDLAGVEAAVHDLADEPGF